MPPDTPSLAGRSCGAALRDARLGRAVVVGDERRAGRRLERVSTHLQHQCALGVGPVVRAFGAELADEDRIVDDERNVAALELGHECATVRLHEPGSEQVVDEERTLPFERPELRRQRAAPARRPTPASSVRRRSSSRATRALRSTNARHLTPLVYAAERPSEHRQRSRDGEHGERSDRPERSKRVRGHRAEQRFRHQGCGDQRATDGECGSRDGIAGDGVMAAPRTGTRARIAPSAGVRTVASGRLPSALQSRRVGRSSGA